MESLGYYDCKIFRLDTETIAGKTVAVMPDNPGKFMQRNGDRT